MGSAVEPGPSTEGASRGSCYCGQRGGLGPPAGQYRSDSVKQRLPFQLHVHRTEAAYCPIQRIMWHVQDQARSQVGTQLGSLLSYEGQGESPGKSQVCKRGSWLRALRFWQHLLIAHKLNYCGPLQVSDDPTVPQQNDEDANQQRASPSAAEMPTSQDDGWDEQPGWDFQDVPLDSPRSIGRQTSTSQKSTPDRRPAHAARHGQTARGKGDSHDMQLASLQKANDALTARLKHVETVRSPYLGLSHVCLLMLSTCRLLLSYETWVYSRS